MDSDVAMVPAGDSSSLPGPSLSSKKPKRFEIKKWSVVALWAWGRGSTREKALVAIIEGFSSNLPHEFVEKKFATMLHQCLNSIKKGSAKEIALASNSLGLLAPTVGPGKKSQEILEEAITPISEALKSRSDSSKIASLLDCLAVITFVGGNEAEETDKCMQIMWQVVHPKLGPNVIAAKPSPPVIAAMVSAWSLLLTRMDGSTLDPKSWQGSISYLSTLLEKDDRSVRIVAGEALALIFEIGNLEKISVQDVMHIQRLKAKILNQVRNLSVEAGGKGSAKKDLNNQRNTFRDILEFLEDGYCPETSVKIGGGSLTTATWCQLVQVCIYFKFDLFCDETSTFL
ncbi:putative armadillo-like helical protein [Helianthus annuus]|nr:putative armadillo-like helical protein [Helianthus annuus]KAJ0820592.1 putative armadillo-like helical protein [Helianthus annuus]